MGTIGVTGFTNSAAGADLTSGFRSTLGSAGMASMGASIGFGGVGGV